MAIAAEDVLVCVWSFLRFSTRATLMCALSYPIAAGTLLFLFILYTFFNIFLLFSPFIVGLVLLLGMFWTRGGPVIIKVKQKSDQMPCDGGAAVSCLEKKSRRTNVKKMEWDAKGKYELPSPNDLVSKTVLLAKQVKALNMRHKKRASSNARKSVELDDGQSSLDFDRDISSSSSSDDESENFKRSSKEGGAGQQNGTNKAVQWTDDDQRNLMELGSSEIERNKRLESLIARRRTRKLFKMQIERGLIDLDTILPNQIAPIYITRNIPYVAEIDGMQTPDSAPSVLAKARNPFDLPYDSSEEKPDLKTDSFQQEFAAAAHRDLVYSRHESFRYGPSYQVGMRLRALEGLGLSRLKRKTSLGNHDRRIEMLSKNEENDERVETDKVEVEQQGMSHTHIDNISEVVDIEATTKAINAGRSKAKKNRENDIEGMGKMRNDQNVTEIPSRSEAHLQQRVTDNDDSSDDESTSASSSSSSDEDEQYRARKSVFSQNVAAKIGRVPPKPINPFSIPSYEKARMEDRLFFAERSRCHTRSFSIASDMQVEVSDIGSPPLTVDGADSPTDQESLGSDCNVDKDYTWEPSSSQMSTTEENVSKFNDMHGLNEKDLANIASSGNSKNAEDVETAMHLQQPDELDDTYSMSSTITGLQADSRALSMSLEDVKLAMEEVGQLSTSDLSNAPSPVNYVEKLMSPEKLVAQEMESSSNPPDESTQENVVTANRIDDLKDVKEMNSDVELAEAKSGPLRASEDIVEESSTKEGDSLNLVTQAIEKNENLNRKEGSKDMLIPFVTINSSDLNQESEPEKSTSQNDAYDTSHTSKDRIQSADQQNLATQEENSKLPEKSTEEANIIQEIQAQDVSQKGTETAAELEVPAEEVRSVSEKETLANAETEKRENAKQNETVAALESRQTVEEIASVTNSTEEIGSISVKASVDPSEVKEPTEIIESDSNKAMQVHTELNKEVELLDLEKSMEAPSIDLKRSIEDVTSISQKPVEAASELKKPAEEIGDVTKELTEANVAVTHN